MPINKEFGRRLSAALNGIAKSRGRNQMETTRAELAEIISLSESTVKYYMSGHVPPEHEIVKKIALYLKKEAHLDREAMANFLNAAKYPLPKTVLDEMYPNDISLSVASLISYCNLDAPPFSDFIMREGVFDNIVDALNTRSAIVLLHGLGGMGKTSLAYEIASRCSRKDDKLPKYQAIIWVSDKPNPGSINLDVLLNETLITLDYKGHTTFNFQEKKASLNLLLRSIPTLFVVDNFETITDSSLLDWLVRLPERCKALITSREYSKKFRTTWPVELTGMNEEEALKLVKQQLKFLGLKIPANLKQYLPLVEAAGGNPKAIEIELGYLKRSGKPLQKVIDEMKAAQGELFDDIFNRCWNLLDEKGRNTIMSMTLFSKSVNAEALAAVAELNDKTVVEKTTEQLTDLALLDMIRVDNPEEPARYEIHSLVRYFAEAKLRKTFEEEAKKRQIAWCIQFTSHIGYSWQNLDMLKLLDNENERENILAVLQWCYNNNQWREVLQIAEGINYYNYERGLWKEVADVNDKRISAATLIPDKLERTRALAGQVQLYSKQSGLDKSEVEQYIRELRGLVSDPDIEKNFDPYYFDVQYALALYAESISDLEAAAIHWRNVLTKARNLSNSSSHREIAALIGLGRILYAQNSENYAKEAKAYLQEALQKATSNQPEYSRGIINSLSLIISMDLDKTDFVKEETKTALDKCWLLAKKYDNTETMAYLHRLYGRYHRETEWQEAIEHLQKAAKLHDKLGMMEKKMKDEEEINTIKGRMLDV